MGGKIKDFQKVIVDDTDWKDAIGGDHVCKSIETSWSHLQSQLAHLVLTSRAEA